MMCWCSQGSLNEVLWKREEKELNSDEGKGGGGASVLAGPLRVSGVSIVGEIKVSSPKELGEKRDWHMFLHL